MALIDELEKVNAVLTFSERVNNLEGRGVLSTTTAKVAREKIQEYLDTIFPPPPPET